jgi:DNA-binding SARP family transcriptional activator
MLRILLLGPPAIYDADHPVQINRRSLRALLYYLACHDHPITRAETVLLFWPDESEQEARRHLREILSKLNKQLPNPNDLLKAPDLIGINHSQVYVDVLEFLKLANEALQSARIIPETTPLPKPVANKMRQAVLLWRSPRFLGSGEMDVKGDFDRWLLNISQNLENLRLVLLDRLISHCIASGDLETAIIWDRLLLEMDELNNEGHIRLLNWLMELGRRSEALNHCVFMREVFKREGFNELPEDMQQACRLVQDGNAQKSSVPTVKAHWPAVLNLQIPFVGRQEALNELSMRYHAGGTAIVVGESGIGKTRLVYELYNSLDIKPRLLYLQGRPLQTHLTYQPLIEMLRHCITPEDWQQLDAVWAAQLVRLAPEILKYRQDITMPVIDNSPETRSLLFEALLILVRQITAKQKCLIVLDDAQWCDESTIDALEYLVEHQVPGNRGLLLMTSRLEEFNSYLNRAVIRLQHFHHLLVVRLDNLEPDEVGELSRFVLGYALPDEVLRNFLIDTGGNPFVVLEMLRMALERNPEVDVDGILDDLPLTSNAYGYMKEHVRLLQQQTEEIGAAAAVIGNVVDPLLLEMVTGYEAAQVVKALEELERVQIIRRCPDEEGKVLFVFKHDRMREVYASEMNPARKRMLHLRTAQALESLHGEDDNLTALAAEHYEQGGDLHKAFHCWLEAAQHAHKNYFQEDALRIYQHISQIIPQLNGCLDENEIYQYYASWGALAIEMNIPELMREAHDHACCTGKMRQSRLLVGMGLSGIGRSYLNTAHPENGLKDMEDAIEALEETDNLFEIMKAYNRKAMLLVTMDRFSEAMRVYTNTIQLGEGNQSDEIIKTMAEAEYLISSLLILRGFPSQAWVLSQKSLERYKNLNDDLGLARAGAVYAITLYHQGYYKEALKQCLYNIKVFQDTHNWRQMSTALVYAARCEMSLGHPDESWDYMHQALETSQSKRLLDTYSLAMCFKGDFYRYLGQPVIAVECFREGVQNKELFYPFADYQARYGMALIEAGNSRAGLQQIKVAADHARKVGLGQVFFPAELNLAGYYAASGDSANARLHGTKLMDEFKGRGFLKYQIIANEILGWAAFFDGNYDETRRLSKMIIAEAGQIQQPWLELEGYMLLGAIAKAQPRLNEVHHERVQWLLAEISKHAQRTEINSIFRKYKKFVESHLP